MKTSNSIKQLRLEVDSLVQLTEDFKTIKKHTLLVPESTNISYDYSYSLTISDECKNAKQSLLFAKAWLGKCMAELGSTNPYGSGYKEVKDIQPTADVAISKPSQEWLDSTHIERVDKLRTMIEDTLHEDWSSDMSEVGEIALSHNGDRWKAEFCYKEYIKYMCEARFHLGFELQRIKEEN